MVLALFLGIVPAGLMAQPTGGQVKAAGGNAYALAIHNTGAVRAKGSAVRDGHVGLVAHRGETALIGGDFQGKNPAVPNAQTTTVAPTR